MFAKFQRRPVQRTLLLRRSSLNMPDANEVARKGEMWTAVKPRKKYGGGGNGSKKETIVVKERVNPNHPKWLRFFGLAFVLFFQLYDSPLYHRRFFLPFASHGHQDHRFFYIPRASSNVDGK